MDEFEHQLPDWDQTTEQQMPSQAVRNELISGKLLEQEVQPGLFATGMDVEHLDDMVISQSVDTPTIYCGIQLSARSEPVDVDGLGRVNFEQGRPFVLGFGNRSHCKSCYHTGARCSFAGFMLRPAFFERFSDSISDEGIKYLQDFMEKGVSVKRYSHCPQLVELAHQTLHHPYQGVLGDLFLEGSVLALVAEAGRLVSEDCQARKTATLTRKQYERVRSAREILDSAISAPPLMRDLAQQIGINATTLQKEFQQAFGVTVFGYVREQRLQFARALLRTQELAVSQIAYRVGFTNADAFATAYRRRFGHPPSSEKPALL